MAAQISRQARTSSLTAAAIALSTPLPKACRIHDMVIEWYIALWTHTVNLLNAPVCSARTHAVPSQMASIRDGPKLEPTALHPTLCRCQGTEVSPSPFIRNIIVQCGVCAPHWTMIFPLATSSSVTTTAILQLWNGCAKRLFAVYKVKALELASGTITNRFLIENYVRVSTMFLEVSTSIPPVCNGLNFCN